MDQSGVGPPACERRPQLNVNPDSTTNTTTSDVDVFDLSDNHASSDARRDCQVRHEMEQVRDDRSINVGYVRTGW